MKHFKIILAAMTTLVFIALIQQASAAAGGLNCTITAASTCNTNFTKLLGLENDTGGSSNAHAQNSTLGTYANSLCCQATETGVNLSDACTGEIFLRLSDTSNAHVQQEQVNTYPEDACVESTLRTPSCQYETGSCSAGLECLLSMENSEGSNTTNAHVGPCSSYTTKVCCNLSNSAPSQVTLILPENGTSITNRTPFFNWTQSTDPDGDPITYRIQVALDTGFSSIVIDQSTSNTNYTQPSELDFDQYFWRVYANDSSETSVSATENFTIVESVILTMINNTVDFGTLSPGQQNGTEDDSPTPFLIRNDGNTEINVSINSTQLFDAASLGTSNYRFKADNDTAEPGSFDRASSTTTYTNMDSTLQNAILIFNHTDTNDQAEVDIEVTVPNDEPGGSKSATVTVLGEVS